MFRSKRWHFFMFQISKRLEATAVTVNQFVGGSNQAVESHQSRFAEKDKKKLFEKGEHQDDFEGSTSVFTASKNCKNNFLDSDKIISDKKIPSRSQSLKNAKTESILDLSVTSDKENQANSVLTAIAPTATVAKRPMLDCETMSFALASPLDKHMQPPTSHPLMLSNVLHNKGKQGDVELSNFLARRKTENEKVIACL